VLEPVAVAPRALVDYEPHAGADALAEVRRLAEPLRGARILHVNATAYGGGVAELLPAMTALMRDLRLEAEWRVIQGDDAFFAVTKALHNGLQGPPFELTAGARETFERASERFAAAFEGSYDFVVIHDPQPVALRRLLPDAAGRWIWRCHIELTDRDPRAWALLRPLVQAYEAAIYTLAAYAPPDAEGPLLAVIAPSIDPLSPKNAPLEPGAAGAAVRRFGLDPARPLITQVSRFDPWKDPLGVVDAYRRVRKRFPEVQLALVGSMASDDPEGQLIHAEVMRAVAGERDVHVLSNLDGVGAPEVNAFQRASDVVVQKSLREGFGLTVSEALWKGTPVVGGRVGGIPIQVVDGETGILVDSIDDCADACARLLADPDLRRRMGVAGHERVRRHFLVTRELRDHLALFLALSRGDPSLIPTGDYGGRP